MKKVRIAYFIPSLKGTGPVFLLSNLCRALNHKENVEITVFYFDDIIEVQFSCPTQRINYNTPIRFDEFDIIHAHCFRADRYINRWRKKIQGVKTISTLHQDTYESFVLDSNYSSLKSYIITRYWCYLQGRNDYVVSISELLRKKYERYIKCPVTTIYNGINTSMPDCHIDESILSQIRQMKNRGYILLCTYALITKRKGISQVIKVLADMPNFAFVIIGNGPEKENLESQVRELGIIDRVLFFPKLDYPYLYIKDCDIYVMPSYSEGFGLSMVEAAFYKKAIVCSSLPSFHEIFNAGEAVFFEVNDVESLKLGIINASQQIDALSKKAHYRAASCYTSEVLAENHMKLYMRLLESDRQRCSGVI